MHTLINKTNENHENHEGKPSYQIPLLMPKVWGSSIESEKYYSRQRNRLTGVPKPDAASQPAWAGKPVVPHPVADPLVISVNAAEPVE